MSDAASNRPPLSAGLRLGPYEIVSLLGAGGMGEVYRARDTRLGRDVAVKVIAFDVSRDPSRVRRFEQEARTVAALNHPNLLSVFDVGTELGSPYVVFELLDGETLRSRMAGEPLPLRKALDFSIQIARGLAAAHERGVVHRDLKPENLLVTKDGRVKILDFGLAKLLLGEETVGATGDSGTRSAETSPGTLLGTVGYMSPEQVRGQAVDARSDIFSLGAVLYEMLSGRRAFRGETSADTLTAILKQEPPSLVTPPGAASKQLERVVLRCLEKVPEDRFQSARDMAFALESLSEGGDVPATSTWRVAPRSRLGLRVAAPILLAVAIVVAFLTGRRVASRGETSSAAIHFGISFPGEVPAYGVAVSPDGRQIAVGVLGRGLRILVHSLDTSETRPLAGSEDGRYPFWSPDGSSIGFFTLDGKVKRADVKGGPPVVVCAAAGNSQGGSWSRKGVLLFASNGRLLQVPASGTTPTPVAVVDEAGESALRSSPQFLPDDRHFIYHATGRNAGAVYVGSLNPQRARRLLDSDHPAAFVAPGHLLFVRGTALMAQAFDAKSLALQGHAFLLAPDAAPGFVGGVASFSASGTGVLALMPTRGGTTGQLTWFDRAGKVLGAIQQPPGVEYLNPVLSPSGEQVAVNRMDPQTGNWDVWILDLTRDVASRLTVDPARDSDPVWSPDGKEIVFESQRGGETAMYRKRVDGSGPEELLLKAADGPTGAARPLDWSRDGRFILYSARSRRGSIAAVWALPLVGDRRPIPVVENEFFNYAARLSPDGRWISYSSLETGAFEIYVQRFMAPGEKKQISRGGGSHPRWSSDGREIVYWANPSSVLNPEGLVSVSLELGDADFRAGVPKALITTPIPTLIDARPHYDVTRDGRRFLLRQAAGPPGPAITVILNWTDRSKR